MAKYLDYAGLGYLTAKIKRQIESNATGTRTAGLIVPFAGTAAPSGYLLCDGTAVSRTEYPELFEAIGTTYGAGDGSTTFNVPDMRGRFPLGANGSHALASKGGEESHTLTIAEMPSHNHGVDQTFFADNPATFTSHSTAWGGHRENPVMTSHTGGSQPHNNMPPYLAANYIVSTGKVNVAMDSVTSADVLQKVAQLETEIAQMHKSWDTVAESPVSWSADDGNRFFDDASRRSGRFVEINMNCSLQAFGAWEDWTLGKALPPAAGSFSYGSCMLQMATGNGQSVPLLFVVKPDGTLVVTNKSSVEYTGDMWLFATASYFCA